MKRHKLSKRASKRIFRKSVNRVHKKNVKAMRGGIRL